MTRMSISLVAAALAAFVSNSVASGQWPSGPPREPASKGIAAMDRARSADKYLFVFFWKERNEKADAMWNVLQPALSKVADKAESVAVNILDPAEKPMVAKFGLDRSPMPLVLAIAPNGAITKGFPLKLDEKQFSEAFVSPVTAACLKAMQSRKLVLLYVERRSPQVRQVSLQQGVVDFATDNRFAGATEVIRLDPADPAEQSFLKELKVDPRTADPITVFLAPPGSVVGKFDGMVTKEQLVTALEKAQSNPCAGGKCGPNGCGPK